MSKVGSFVFAGRFQPPHLGHIAAIRDVHEEYNCKIIVGIVNPDPHEIMKGDGQNWPRFSSDKNPLTYWERLKLFRLALADENMEDAVEAIIPLPRPSINHEKANRFLPHGQVNFILVNRWKDEIEEFKERAYRDNGYGIVKVEQNELPTLSQIASGTLIRNLVTIDDSRWGILVPNSEIEYLLDIDFPTRVKEYIDGDTAQKSVQNFFENDPLGENAREVFQGGVESLGGGKRSPKEGARIHTLLRDLREVEHGDSGNKFDRLVGELLSECFSDLDRIKDPKTANREYQRGIFDNRASSKVFQKLRRKYDSEYVILETVNRNSIDQNSLNRITDRLTDVTGQFGLMVYNGSTDKDIPLESHRRKLFNEGKLVLIYSINKIDKITNYYLSGNDPASFVGDDVRDFEVRFQS